MRINAVDSEDLLRYAPDILVRKRHVGDTQDPISTRTSGIGQSARSLIYADGILLSSPIGNNNGAASPHWGLVSPDDVSVIDILYGPFTARYPGGSMGAVLDITTRMPDGFELRGKALGSIQGFEQYGTNSNPASYQMEAEIGDRDGAFAWRFSLNHVEADSQPLAYVTLAQSTAPSGAGTPVTGAYADVSRTGAPITVVGAGGIERQVEDTPTVKTIYDLSPAWRLSYTASLFHQDDDATAQSYLKDAGGNPVYSGTVNIGGLSNAIPATAFANNIYHWNQTYLAQGLSLKSVEDGAWRWEAVVSRFDYLADSQRVPGLATSAAGGNGGGTINRMTGTAWTTADLRGGLRTTDNDFSFGLHDEIVTLDQVKTNTADWIAGPSTQPASLSKGRTATAALWGEDAFTFAADWKITLGLRLEQWRAYGGRNYSATPALDVTQPGLSGTTASPKASLAWHAAEDVTVTASYGDAYRMPTVTELYQAITTGPTLTSPNPNLAPEHANSYDLSMAYGSSAKSLRLSLFQEDVSGALISQTAPLNGSTTLFSYVQNIDFVRSRGAEMVTNWNDAILPGLGFQGSATFVDSRIVRDAAFAAAIGKRTPSIPKWRAAFTATYHAAPRLDLSLGARYEDRLYATIDNSDTVSHTFQGFDGFLVADARARYSVTDHWSAAFGVDNLNNEKYFLFHPFPQRSLVIEIQYAP